jgi:hypothetical protein
VSPEDRARIGTQVRASRQRQGLGPHVTDPATLDRLAARVEQATGAHGLGPQAAERGRHAC